MDDVIDRRTRLIYASLADHELARQLEEAHLAAQRRRARPRHTGHGSPGRPRALGTRPWVSATPVEDDAVMNADITSSGTNAHVIDLTEPAQATTVDVTAPAVHLVGRQQSSEWATDDPSYYLG